MLKVLLFLIIMITNICKTSAIAWDFSKHSIPLSEIYSGGPSKDGITDLTHSKFIGADKVTFLVADERVLGIFLEGEAKAYPIRILNWHEVVNDIVGSRPVVITYCPLTGSGIAFEAPMNGKRITFGVSGTLYNNNVLLYDHETESLWSQLKMQAVTGRKTKTLLKPLAIFNTTWRDWKGRYPQTQVMSLDTGYSRDYQRNPYEGYEKIEQVYFPLSQTSKKLPAKEWVLGIILNGEAKAYPFRVLAQRSSPLPDNLGGEDILLHFNQKEQSAWAQIEEGEIISSVQVFWFAWYAFYPETKVFQLREDNR